MVVPAGTSVERREGFACEHSGHAERGARRRCQVVPGDVAIGFADEVHICGGSSGSGVVHRACPGK